MGLIRLGDPAPSVRYEPDVTESWANNNFWHEMYNYFFGIQPLHYYIPSSTIQFLVSWTQTKQLYKTIKMKKRIQVRGLWATYEMDELCGQGVCGPTRVPPLTK